MSLQEKIKSALDQSTTYLQYRQEVQGLFDKGNTTGPNQSENMVYYTGLNLQRMQKWEKHYEPSPESKEVVQSLNDEIWLVLTEGWCGDAAHSVPVMYKLSELNPKVELRMVLRDENLPLMDEYLTNGGRSIPKLLRLEKHSLRELGTWGPRPEPAQNIFYEKRAAGIAKEEYTRDIQIWYARDRGKTIEKELLEMVRLNHTAKV